MMHIKKSGTDIGPITDTDFYNDLVKDHAGTMLGSIFECTKDLYDTFITLTKESAKRRFAFYEKINSLKYEELVEKYKHLSINRFSKTPIVMLSKEGSKVKEAAGKAIRMGYQAFSELAVDKSRQHYVHSAEKLEYRLTKKGISYEQMEVSHARIDNAGNIEIVFRGNGQIVRAWTIIAQGPIRSPHYRYLIR